jgi:hypothetical protein
MRLYRLQPNNYKSFEKNQLHINNYAATTADDESISKCRRYDPNVQA